MDIRILISFPVVIYRGVQYREQHQHQTCDERGEDGHHSPHRPHRSPINGHADVAS